MGNYRYCKTRAELLQFISGYRDVSSLKKLSTRELRGVRWQIIQQHEDNLANLAGDPNIADVIGELDINMGSRTDEDTNTWGKL